MPRTLKKLMPEKTVVTYLRLAVFCLCSVLLCCALRSESAFAAGDLKMYNEDDRELTWSLNADRMVASAGGDVLEAYGNVVIQRGDDFLKADYARYYSSTSWVFLLGNVTARMNGDNLKAQEAEFNLTSRTGWLINGELFMAGPHTYFSGEHITKHWGDVYSFKKAKVTTCDGENPAWSFTADSAVVELDGYAQLWGAAFQVKNAPVLYSPFMVVPAKTERQTGFLTPEFGHSSRNGYFYNQPYFWAIDQSRDLTLSEYYMSRRGFMHGANYRSRASEDESMWLRFDWLKDRRDQDSAPRRDNSSRYWLRGMYDWRLPAGMELWRVRADIDVVSDAWFMKNFKSGYSGFNGSRRELFDWFSRDLAEIDKDRISKVMLFREWERGSVYFAGTYTQNPYYGNGNASRNTDTTVQTLPELNAYLHKGRLLEWLPLEFSGSTSAGYKYRRNGTSGGRLDFSPQATLPIVSDYGTILASGTFHYTWYSSDRKGYADRPGSRITREKSRTISDFDIEGSTNFSRVYNLGSVDSTIDEPGSKRWTAVKHNVVPKVEYRYRPNESQGSNPQYDAYDRLNHQNELTYSLENNFTRKREQVAVVKNAEGVEETVVKSDYLEVLRVKLSQTYDVRESKRNDDLDKLERRPFRDIEAEVNVAWDHRFGLNSITHWSTNNGNLTRQDHRAYVNLPNNWNFYTSLDFRNKFRNYYSMREDRLTMLGFGGFMSYGPWTTNFYYKWSIHGQAATEYGVDIAYNHQCFSIIGRLSDDGMDTSFSLLVSLSGLGI